MDTIVIPDSDETLMLCDESRSKMLLKEQDPMVVKHRVNTKPINYDVLISVITMPIGATLVHLKTHSSYTTNKIVQKKEPLSQISLAGHSGEDSPWRISFLRYIDRNQMVRTEIKLDHLGPYVPSTYLNMTPVKQRTLYGREKKQFSSFKLVLDDGYLFHLQEVKTVKTNLFWEFGKFTSRDGETMESYYSRFYKLMNELTRNNLQVTTMQVNVQFLQQLQPEWSRFVTVVKQLKEIDTISYHILFDILKQYQNEVNDIRAERIAKSANPLALLAAAQPYSDNYYQAPKPQRTNATSSSTRLSSST
ncbi:hypothetical protein Tco_0499655 [Tanacetum coccineum]